MRRTRRDVHALFEAYCRAWEHESKNRVDRLAAHGWVDGVWVREYDGVVRMRPTETGRQLIRAYWAARCDDVAVFERYDSVPAFVASATES